MAAVFCICNDPDNVGDVGRRCINSGNDGLTSMNVVRFEHRFDRETKSACTADDDRPMHLLRLIDDGTTSADSVKAQIQCWCDLC